MCIQQTLYELCVTAFVLGQVSSVHIALYLVPFSTICSIKAYMTGTLWTGFDLVYLQFTPFFFFVPLSAALTGKAIAAIQTAPVTPDIEAHGNVGNALIIERSLSSFSATSSRSDVERAPESDTDDTCTIRSAARQFKELEIVNVSSAEFVKRTTEAVDDRIQAVVSAVAELALSAKGGCAYVVAESDALCALKSEGIDFSAVDKNDKWPDGYMTHRLQQIHVSHPAFREAVQEFSEHTSNDRWPIDHEACNLPKDGFTALVDSNGYRLRCAVRLLGLPVAAYRWDRVGTRHQAALQIAYRLRTTPSAVIVRSDSNTVHSLVPSVDHALGAFGCTAN